MKKVILTMVALLSMTAMMAQNNDKGERKAPKQLTPEEMTEKMAQDLSLTPEQKTKVLALNQEYQDIHKGPRMGGQRPPRPQAADGSTGATSQQRPERPQLTEEQKAEMQKQMERRREFDAKLKDILNANQYEQYQKQRRHGGPGHRGHGGPGRPGGPGHGPRPNMW